MMASGLHMETHPTRLPQSPCSLQITLCQVLKRQGLSLEHHVLPPASSLCSHTA